MSEDFVNKHTPALILGAKAVETKDGRYILAISTMLESGQQIDFSCFPEAGSDSLEPFMNQGCSHLMVSTTEPEKFAEFAEIAESGDPAAILDFITQQILPATKGMAETFLSGDADAIAEAVEVFNDPETNIVGRIVEIQFYPRKSTTGRDGREFKNYAVSSFDTREENAGKLPRNPVPITPCQLDGVDVWGGNAVAEAVDNWRNNVANSAPSEEEVIASTASQLAKFKSGGTKKASKKAASKKGVPFA